LESNSTKLFPDFNLHNVDISILFNWPGRPIAIFEKAKKKFDCSPHKDFTKLAAMMSSLRIKLANDLITIRKRPEEARAFGALIGK
jgi:hypothetical protein